MRLDVYLVENGYFESRNRALEAIKSGKVKVDGKIAKPSVKCDEKSNVEVENEKFYASRAGRKLEAFLEEHEIDLNGKKALDIGSSTGGFAQILLENGVESLTCVDVGTNQLHFTIRDDKRAEVHENCDIRNFRIDGGFGVISCDVSFISLEDILNDINTLALYNCDIILLYKPQFEVGRLVKRDSNGVVTDIDAIRHTRVGFEKKCEELGWKKIIDIPSRIQGKEGNIEYFYHFRKVEV
ncbi:MAG: TlyA family RNA methyltransferase [Sulfurovaceae bacterium]|nr:TlyA family RNA methyltransferase [Sulfurovaceae bacterium]MDD5549100.1 TlyA family RNA methyltransferase [Sulfurovaceae bacterium]